MSVIVKGMDMPKNCAYCPLSEYRNTSLGQILDCKRIGTVGSAVRGTHDVLNHRHPNCPLAEIHTPHGRLIDIDDAIESYGERAELGYVSQSKFLNVVIEAEGGEE